MLADVAKSRGRLPVRAPLALAAMERIDAIFSIEREINGLDIADRPQPVRRGIQRRDW